MRYDVGVPVLSAARVLRWTAVCAAAGASWLLLGAQAAPWHPDADWEAVVEGVDYREFVYPLPNRAYVARMDRTNPGVILDSALASGSTHAGKETVSSLAARYDQSLNAWGGAWGPRNRVVVAINGAGFDLGSGFPQGGQVQSGSYLLRYGQLTGGSGFVWTEDRDAFVGGCLAGGHPQQTVTHIPSGKSSEIDVMNSPQDGPGLWLYTHHYGPRTPEAASRIQVRIELDRPFAIVSPPRMVLGTVREVADGDVGLAIYFDHVVLASSGRTADSFLEQLHAGDQVGFSADLRDLNLNCRGGTRNEWDGAYASLDAGFVFLRDGRIRETDDLGGNTRDPRTAVCVNSEFIYFVVVDGRQDSWSVGMTFSELGEFCRDELDARWGLNQDGGGSSAIWVDGVIRNRPSDGRERAVGNGWLMVALEPSLRSDRFQPGYEVWTLNGADLRQGPGTEFPSLGSLPAGMLVTIIDSLADTQGLFAKGSFWWRVRANEDEGWVPEQALLDPESGPSIYRIIQAQDR
jgi:hypothetical protein